MKIAICGSGQVFDEQIKDKCKEIGHYLAKNFTVLTGSCHGYPNEVAKACFENNGTVIGMSPAHNNNEHITEYNFPTDNFNEIIYTGNGIPGRNLDLIKEADIVLILDGKVGTLNEFTLAMTLNKKIYVLKMGNLYKLLPDIIKVIEKGNKNNVKFIDNCNQLSL